MVRTAMTQDHEEATRRVAFSYSGTPIGHSD